jgi:5-methylthioadenosine/S-adenosylhomocysteine deaminase
MKGEKLASTPAGAVLFGIMQNIDMLIHARWVIPVEPAHKVFDQYAVAIHDGRILELLPSGDAGQKYQAQEQHHLDRHALIPGLINAHTHAAMTLFRGLADDLPLMDWLQNHIWPAESRWVSAEFVHDGTQLAVAEMIRGGTTCFNDMYFFADETARVADNAGIRASVGLILLDFPTVWANDADEYIHKGIEIHDRFRHHPLINTVFAPHAPYTVSDAPLKRVVTLAEELDIPIHMHVHETEHEVTEAVQNIQQRPLQRLQELGLVSPRLLAVHMTQLNDEEIARFTETGAHVVHCPESNMKLASGYCPVQRLHEANINVALGTDGAASNNDLDMLGEIKTAALLAKAVSGEANAMPAADVLRMATINGAKALGLDNIIGSLEPGKAADLVAVELDEIATQPIYNPLSQIVYAAGRHQITDVWIAGKQLLNNRALTTLDEKSVISKAKTWAEKIYAADKH